MTSTISTSNFRTLSTATHDMASSTFTTTAATAATATSNHLHRIPTSISPIVAASLDFLFFNFHHSSTISKLSLTKTHTKLKHISPISAAKSNSTVVQSTSETPIRVSLKRVAKKNPNLRENDIGQRIMELGSKVEKGSEESASIRVKDRSFRGGGRRYGFDKIGSGDKKMVKRNEVKKSGDVGRKGFEKTDAELREIEFRVALDSCSKHGDVMGGIGLYDEASKEGLKLSQYHYSVLLYLCSSAATGVVRPAKSGSSSRTLGLNGVSSADSYGASRTDNVGSVVLEEANVILVSDEVKKYAVERGCEVYRRMCEENVQMNEATFTAMARIAMSMGNGDLAFDVVKQMKRLGIIPKLRSYGPALSAFCTSGNVEKAFEVESDMLEQGIDPEEPELEALLRASVGAGNGDKVYYLLHKLRVNVRRVSSTTAELVQKWFESKEAAMVGKSKWNRMQLKVATENGGGGWHGQGWLGKGPWVVSTTTVGNDGFCKCCGERLALIDLDPLETEKFAESVASIAMKREKHSNFQKFQQWLDYYGPFEAVVDAANVGLYSQHRFMPTKINAVVNGIRQMLPSKKWPLIVLHNRRVTGNKMDEEVNKALVEKWKNADALYPTPTGSNDDWYWLYAAIKFKCLLVTNDEMRDHTFQLLGNDFFPKWKERHQVRFSFNETGPVFHMPPPCSVVIQESEHGCWHIPIDSEVNTEEERTWLCITRVNNNQRSTTDSKVNVKVPLKRRAKTVSKNEPEEMFTKLKSIIASGLKPSKHRSISILSEIHNAEKFSNCTIDFQI